MKISILILLAFIKTNLSAQTFADSLRIDSLIKSIDKLSITTAGTRWKLGHINYQTIDGKSSKLTYSYDAGPKQVIETFYVKDNFPVFAKRVFACYFLYGESIHVQMVYCVPGNKAPKTKNFQEMDLYDCPEMTDDFIVQHYKQIMTLVSNRKK